MRNLQFSPFAAFTSQRKRTIAAASFLIGIAATIAFFTVKKGGSVNPFHPEKPEIIPLDELSAFEIRRLDGYKNIQPVVSVDAKAEDEKFAPLKKELESLIAEMKQEGAVSDVSIFLKNMRKGQWMSLNEAERYHPASLMKVPLMLGVLKAAEASPGLLEKKIVYQKAPQKQMLPQYFQGPSIEAGKSYTVHELIYYCVAYSDNQAAHALESNIDLKSVLKMFGDVGLPTPDLSDADFKMTAREYSTFMNAIFNSAFLSPEYSEYAAEMLAQSDFKEGFAKGLPSGTKSWRKFGEWSRQGAEKELHESGVIFVDGRPFLLTVMARGNGYEGLAKALQEISRLIAKRTTKAEFGSTVSIQQRFVGC